MSDYYKYQQDEIDAEAADKKANLKESKGLSDFTSYGLKAIADYLAKSPKRYRDYGVYWWALKDALKSKGHLFGDESDDAMKAEYAGKNAAETLVMAGRFRRETLAEFVVGNNRWLINDDGEFYTLFDEDMESYAS